MNTRFSVATHILTFLQTQAGEPATSELIASSVNTNASLIRRLLSQLSKAGLTKSQMGTGGGALLARPADRITLAQVFGAVDEGGDVFAIHSGPNPRCPVGRNIQAALRTQIDAAEEALRTQLSKTTIAEMADSVAANERPSRSINARTSSKKISG
jgi:Rrf2 family protein